MPSSLAPIGDSLSRSLRSNLPLGLGPQIHEVNARIDCQVAKLSRDWPPGSLYSVAQWGSG